MPSIKIGDAYFEMKMEGVDRELNKSKAKVKKSGVAGGKAYSTGFTSSLKTIGKSLAALGIARGLFNIGQSSVKLAGNLQQAQVAFTTMLGSAQEADKLLGDLSNFAKETPFELTGIRQNAKQLLAMGISNKRLMPTLKSLGDVSAGLSVPLERLALNYGQVISQTKLTGRELKDFTTAGVPLLEQLSEQLGKTTAEVQDMISDGNISAEMVTEAFEAMTSEGGKFANMMDAQSKTYQGVVSNFQDSVDLLGESVGTKLLPVLANAVTMSNDFLEKIGQSFDRVNSFRLEEQSFADNQVQVDEDQQFVNSLRAERDLILDSFSRGQINEETRDLHLGIVQDEIVSMQSSIDGLTTSIQGYNASQQIIDNEIDTRTDRVVRLSEMYEEGKIPREQYIQQRDIEISKIEELKNSSYDMVEGLSAAEAQHKLFTSNVNKGARDLFFGLGAAMSGAIDSVLSSSAYYQAQQERLLGGQSITNSANGNFLRSGQASFIGERGPELFVPSVPGNVVSNNTTTNNNNISVNNPGGDGFMLGMRIGDGLRRGI